MQKKMQQIQGLIEQGKFFSAYEAARALLGKNSESLELKQIMARSLILTGSFDEARLLLESILPLANENNPRSGEETAGLLGRSYKEIWLRTGDLSWGIKSREAYRFGYSLTGGLWPGINAATMSYVTGQKEEAEALAEKLSAFCNSAQPSEENAYWIYASLGEACLLLDKKNQAVEAYKKAVANAGGVQSKIVSSRRQLALFKNLGIQVPDILFDILSPSAVIQFAGHMLDRPGREKPRFPSSIEKQVKKRIELFLDRFDAAIGYCSAACGGDILFAEAMLAKKWELNIMLPFALDDFIKTSVAYAGEKWVKRCQSVLRRAASIRFLTEEPYLGDEVLFNFAGTLFQGIARLRGESLLVEPYLLALWDGIDTGFTGGTADIIKGWRNKTNLEIIRSDSILAGTPVSPGTVVYPGEKATPALQINTTGEHEPRRIIKTLMFADIAGYSKLKEQHTPLYMYYFLSKIADDLKKVEVKPSCLNTWGDAVFAVMDSAVSMAYYADALIQCVCKTDWTEYGLPADMNIRIALHAGPVFEGTDPLSGRKNYYGSHVNRAARIELSARAGVIYASEQFAALLKVEQGDAQEFECAYVGNTELAKNFGNQILYSLRRKRRQL